MFLKLTEAESNRNVYVNFDRANSFYRAEKEFGRKNTIGTKIVFDSNEYEESWAFVKETPEQIMEMLNGCEQSVKTTSVLYGENGIKLNELTV